MQIEAIMILIWNRHCYLAGVLYRLYATMLEAFLGATSFLAW
jgi:hypothetical protein